jgi:hypothetical protein
LERILAKIPDSTKAALRQRLEANLGIIADRKALLAALERAINTLPGALIPDKNTEALLKDVCGLEDIPDYKAFLDAARQATESLPKQETTQDLLKGILDDPKKQLDSLRSEIATLPPGPFRSTLHSLMTTNVNNIAEAHQRVEQWFDGKMGSVAARFKQTSRMWVSILALIVTVTLNIDTIAIGAQFWKEPVLIEYASKEVDKLFQDKQDAISSTSASDYRDQIAEKVKTLQALRIPMLWDDGWFGSGLLPGSIDDIKSLWGWKLVGLTISWAAIAQGSSFWYDALKKFKGFQGTASTETQEKGGQGAGA